MQKAIQNLGWLFVFNYKSNPTGFYYQIYNSNCLKHKIHKSKTEKTKR